MLKEYDCINEQGEKVVTKTIQYERKQDYSLKFYNSNKKVSILYDLPNVIENVKNNNIIYFVNCVDMVEALKLDGKFATCLVTDTYNKKELEQALKYLKGATIYILNDNENERKKIKEYTKSNLDMERIFNFIFKTNKNILKILVDIAKEVRLIDYNKQYKNYTDLKDFKHIVELFEYKSKNHLLDDCVDENLQEIIDNGIIVNRTNYINIFRQYKFTIMLFEDLYELTN